MCPSCPDDKQNTHLINLIIIMLMLSMAEVTKSGVAFEGSCRRNTDCNIGEGNPCIWEHQDGGRRWTGSQALPRQSLPRWSVYPIITYLGLEQFSDLGQVYDYWVLGPLLGLRGYPSKTKYEMMP